MCLRRFVFVLLLSGGSCGALMAADVNDFIDFSAEDLPGRLFIPPEAQDPTDSRPVILFLHGAGATGTNNISQIGSNMYYY